MWEALTIAIVAVGLGAFLGTSELLGRRVLSAIQTFGFSAAIALVLLRLLPEAFEKIGWIALPLFLLASRIPAWLEQAAQRALGATRSASLGLDLAYAGFAIHQVTEGLAMGAMAHASHPDRGHVDYYLATGGHTVPLTALLVGLIAGVRGKRAAWLRGAGLAVATAIGIVLPQLFDTGRHEHADAWVAAVAAGFLFHAVGHVGPSEQAANPESLLQRSTWRALDLAAAAAGFWVAAFWQHPTGDGHGHLDAGQMLSVAALFTAPPAAIAILVRMIMLRHQRHSWLPKIAAEQVLPWFCLGTLGASVLLGLVEFPLANRIPSIVVAVVEPLALLLAAGACVLAFVDGTRPFLVHTLSWMSAHQAHDHHRHARLPLVSG